MSYYSQYIEKYNSNEKIFKDIDLILKAQKDKEIFNYIVNHIESLKLIIFVVKKFKKYDVDELVGIGFIGLKKAIEKFNPEFNFKFVTYAIPKIEGEIKRYLRDNMSDKYNGIKVPRIINTIENKLKDIYGSIDDINSIDDAIKILKKELKETITYDSLYNYINFLINVNKSFLKLDDYIYSENSRKESLLERINLSNNDLFDILLIKDYKNKVYNIINNYEYENRNKMKIIFEMTLKEIPQEKIAKIVGLKQITVSKMIRKLIKDVRKYYKINNYENVKIYGRSC